MRQGGLQGRAETEDTPSEPEAMPDMLLWLQGFSQPSQRGGEKEAVQYTTPHNP